MMRALFYSLAILVLVSCSPSQETRVTYAWSGSVTDSSFSVVFMPEATGAYRVEVVDGSETVFSSIQEAQPGTPIRVDIGGLQPSTRYVWRVEGAEGGVTTFASGAFSYTVAVGSCTETGSESPIFEQIAALNPLMYLQTGDLHYGDIETDCEVQMADHLRQVATSATQRTLFASTPFAYMWDDHDFGPNNSAADAPCTDIALATYRRFIPHYPTAFTGAQDPVSQTFDVGRIRYILTDLRSQKVRPEYDPADACVQTRAGTTFGSEAHLEWFLNELLKAKAEGFVVAWVSGIPWINAPGGPNFECGEDDDWGGFPEERTRIARFIQDNAIPLFMISGDAHMVAFDDGSNSEGGFPVFHAAPLDRRGSYKGGPYSHGYSAERGQFGMISVEDRGGDSLHVHFTTHNLTQTPVLNTEGAPIDARVGFKIR